ncbi:hypothetical protein LCGC14_2135850 [marine sediment metagenome]|uniref:Uncharacterized protein n=1 Tax=marine sediment metagenome TaxID=412755 RepID=A0A0F9E008_9ZZZZ|nr:hypothetical protein [bacterium]
MDQFMKAIDFLKRERDEGFCCPHTREKSLAGLPSNTELRRWLSKGSVMINWQNPKPGDEVVFPILQLMFFPGTKSQVTVIQE